MLKKFHDYRTMEITENASDTEKFYMLNYFDWSAGACCSTDPGFAVFNTMLEALEFNVEYLSSFKGDINVVEKTLQRKITQLTCVIERINETGTDEGIKLPMLRLNGACFEYRVDAWGYWGKFVPGALRIFEESARYDLRVHGGKWVGQAKRIVTAMDDLIASLASDSDVDKEFIKRLEDIKRPLERCKGFEDKVDTIEALRKRSDIGAPDFVDAFLKIAMEYGEWE